MNRRTSLSRMAQTVLGLAAFPLSATVQAAATLVKSKAAWQALLPAANYAVLFDDGPQPTGQRYCNNGVALRFIPSEQPLPALRT